MVKLTNRILLAHCFALCVATFLTTLATRFLQPRAQLFPTWLFATFVFLFLWILVDMVLFALATTAFVHACEKGNVAAATWWYATGFANLSYKHWHVFRRACARNDVVLLKQLLSWVVFTNTDVKSDIMYHLEKATRKAIQRGDLAVVEAVVDAFKSVDDCSWRIGNVDLQDELTWLCSNNAAPFNEALRIMQWLTSRPDVDIHCDDDNIFQRVCGMDDWLQMAQAIALLPGSSPRMFNAGFRAACEHGNFHIITWLETEHPPSDIARQEGFVLAAGSSELEAVQAVLGTHVFPAHIWQSAFWKACSNSDLAIAQWLMHRSAGLINVAADDDRAYRLAWCYANDDDWFDDEQSQLLKWLESNGGNEARRPLNTE